MYLYITVAVVTILLASFVTGKEQLHTAGTAGAEGRQLMGGAKHPLSREQCFSMLCLAAVFLILFGLSALRQNVGNDYAKYVEFMHRLYTDAYIDDPGVPTEWGFNLLCRVVYGLSGYENHLLVFAIYSFVTVAFFLSAMYEQSVEFPFSFFMFMTLGYYFQSFSTVRYYLALGIALYSMKYVLRGQWGRFLLLVVAGAAFHKSIWVIVPLYFLASRSWKKWQVILATAFCSHFLFFQNFYMKLVVRLYPTYEGTEFLEGNGISYINVLRCLAVLALTAVCYQKVAQDRNCMFYFYLNLGALILYLFCYFIPVVSRIGYYLTVSQIFFVPALLGYLEKPAMKKLFRFLAIGACILYFMLYLRRAHQDGVLVLPYKCFLFQDMVDILSDVS